MIKSYRGYALPTDKQVAYSLEYLCPRCKAEDVDLDRSIARPIFCDGSPSTGDTISTWKCNACLHQGAGEEFVARLIEDEERY